MAAAFTILFQKIAAVVEWFGKLAVAVFKALWDFVRDAACWPFEQIMEIVVSAVEAVDVTGLSDQVGAWGELAPEIINVLGLLGIGTASTIIASAIAVRLVLQLIPFTRLGS